MGMTKPGNFRLHSCFALLVLLAQLSACGGSSSQPPPVGSPAPTPAPTVSFTVDRATIDAGTTAILQWSSTHATQCAASGDWSGTKLVSDSETTPVLTGSRQFVLSCTGAGGTTEQTVSVTVNPVVRYELRSGVIDLEPSIGLLEDTQDDHLVFSASPGLAVGQVFVLDNVAHKVTSVDVSGGQVVVGISEPEFEEIFESLRLIGTFGTGGVEAGGLGKGKGTLARHQKLSETVALGAGEIEIAATYIADGDINLDYDYTLADGLKFVKVDAYIAGGISNGTWSVAPASGKWPFSTPLGAPIPIPGVPVAQVRFDLGVTLTASATFHAQGTLNGNVAARAKASYSSLEGFSGSLSFPEANGLLGVTTYEGDALQGALTANAKALFQLIPVIKILGKSIIRIPLGVGPSLTASLTGPLNDSCLQFFGGFAAEAELVLVPLPQVELSRGTSFENPGRTFGNCRAPVTLSATTVPEGSVVINDPVTVKVKADPAPKIGNPGGAVTVTLDDESCEVMINGSGECQVTATKPGERQLEIAYAGDAIYSAAQLQAPIAVRSPRIFPETATAVAGGAPISFQLLDGEGVEIKLPNGAFWASSAPAALAPVGPTEDRTTQWQAPITANGATVTITVTDSEQHFTTSAVVTVISGGGTGDPTDPEEGPSVPTGLYSGPMMLGCSYNDAPLELRQIDNSVWILPVSELTPDAIAEGRRAAFGTILPVALPLSTYLTTASVSGTPNEYTYRGTGHVDTDEESSTATVTETGAFEGETLMLSGESEEVGVYLPNDLRVPFTSRCTWTFSGHLTLRYP